MNPRIMYGIIGVAIVLLLLFIFLAVYNKDKIAGGEGSAPPEKEEDGGE